MADDEKKEAVPTETSAYSLTMSVLQDKLLLILHDNKSKRIYQSSFTPKQLQQCGFSDKMVGHLERVSKFIETAKTGHNNLKFEISIEKASKSKAKTNDVDETEGGVQGVATSKATPATQQTDAEVGVIKITKEDDFFGTMAFVMKLQQVPREQSEVNKDLIQDLQQELQQNTITITALQQELQKSREQIVELAQHQMPRGSIVMWSGAVKDIPKGWRLCDGNSATPDLRNRFIVGAGNEHNVGAQGGNNEHRHNVTVNGHQLTQDEIPSHRHEFDKNVWVRDDDKNNWRIIDKGSNVLNYCKSGDANRRTAASGGGQAHSHSATSSSTAHLPPFYALCFIMKLI